MCTRTRRGALLARLRADRALRCTPVRGLLAPWRGDGEGINSGSGGWGRGGRVGHFNERGAPPLDTAGGRLTWQRARPAGNACGYVVVCGGRCGRRDDDLCRPGHDDLDIIRLCLRTCEDLDWDILVDADGGFVAWVVTVV